MSSKEQFEREFESFLNEEDSRIATLYRKLPRPEPDAKLDAAVLAMARRAVPATPRMRAHTPRWIPALSAAAVVALAAGIAFRIGPQVWQERTVPAAQKPANENAPASAAANIEKIQSAETDALKDKAAPTAAAPEAASRAVPESPAPPPPAYSASARQETRAQLRKMEPAARRLDAPAPQAFPKQAAIEQEKKAAENGAATGMNAPPSAAAGDLDAQSLDRKRDESGQAASQPPALQTREQNATPMSTPTAAPPPPQAREEPISAPVPTDATTESALAAPAAKAMRAAPRSKDPNARLYPEHWLANIRILLRENRRDEALHSLTEFRKMYPDYHLPDDLRDLK